MPQSPAHRPMESRIVRVNTSERGASSIFKASWVVVFLSTEMAASMWNFFFLDFLANVAGIDVIYVGVIATMMRVFDAVTDPIVGSISDRSKGHCGFGRRRFCVVVAFVPFAVTWFCQFTVPFEDKDALFWWYLIGSLVANWAWTWVMIPTIALLNEFCTNDKERTLLSTGRFIATGVGSAVSTGGQAAVFSSGLTEETQFALLALIFASFLCLMVANMLWQSRSLVEGEPILSAKDTTWGALLSNYTAVFRVKQFLLVSTLYIVSVISMQFTLNILPFFIRQYLLYTRADVTLVIGIGLAAGFIFLVPVLVMGSPTSRVHINKRTMYFIGATIWMAFFVLLPFVEITNKVQFTCLNATEHGNETYTMVVSGGKEASDFPCGLANTLDYELVRSEGAMYWLFVLAPIFGSGIAITLIVPVALLNDVADVVTLETGLSNEGLVIGLAGLLYKSLAGLLLFGYFGTLRSNGFDDKNEWERDPESELDGKELELIPWAARETIRYWMLVPVGLLSLGLLVNKFSSITPAYMERVQTKLRNRTSERFSGRFNFDEKVEAAEAAKKDRMMRRNSTDDNNVGAHVSIEEVAMEGSGEGKTAAAGSIGLRSISIYNKNDPAEKRAATVV